MRYGLKWVVGQVIPPAINIGVRMKKIPAEVPVLEEAAGGVVGGGDFGPGADMFADATVIPFQEWLDGRSAYTYTKDFTHESQIDGDPNVSPGDSDVDYGYETDPYGMEDSTRYVPCRSTWWKILVPADKVVWCTVDTQSSFGTTASGGYVDTMLGIWALDQGTAVEFGNLSGVAWADDDRQFDYENWFYDYGAGSGNWSRIVSKPLDGSWSGDPAGTWIYFQVVDYDCNDDAQAIVLRLNITETEPNYPPPDGHEPDA